MKHVHANSENCVICKICNDIEKQSNFVTEQQINEIISSKLDDFVKKSEKANTCNIFYVLDYEHTGMFVYGISINLGDKQLCFGAGEMIDVFQASNASQLKQKMIKKTQKSEDVFYDYLEEGNNPQWEKKSDVLRSIKLLSYNFKKGDDLQKIIPNDLYEQIDDKIINTIKKVK